jgi:hypothetical protein
MQSARRPAAGNNNHRGRRDTIADDHENGRRRTRHRPEGHADKGHERPGAGAVFREFRQRVGEEQNHHHGTQNRERRADTGTADNKPEAEKEAHGRSDISQRGRNNLRQTEAAALQPLPVPGDCTHFLIPCRVYKFYAHGDMGAVTLPFGEFRQYF